MENAEQLWETTPCSRSFMLDRIWQVDYSTFFGYTSCGICFSAKTARETASV